MSRSRIILMLVAASVAIVVWFSLFPPRWWLNYIKPVDLADPVSAGKTIIEEYACRQCHLIGGAGRATGPNLAGVTKRLDRVSLRLWLRDPRSIKWKTPMPNFQLSDPEIEAILALFKALDRKGD